MVIQHIHQHDQSDCGVACLASVLHYFRRDVPGLNQLRELSGTNTLGTTMLGLMQAAEECGLVAEGYEADLESLRESDDLTILHVIKDEKWAHYVVCYGFDLRKHVWKIGDPANNSITFLTDDELRRIWVSGKLLLIKDPDPQKRTGRSRRRKLRWLIKLVKDDINILGLALFLGICMSVLGLSTAVFSQKLLDEILPSKDLTLLIVGLGLLFVLLFIRSGFSLIRQIFLYRQSKDFNIRTLDFFLGRLIRLPMTFFLRRKTGDLVARLNDIQRIQKTISTLVANVMIDVMMVFVAIIAVMVYNTVIGLFVLAWIPIFALIVWRFHPPIVSGQEQVMQKYALNEHNFVQIIRGMSPIKSHSRERLFQTRAHHIFEFFQDAIYQLAHIGARFNFYSEIAGTVFIVSVLGWTSYLVYNGEMTAGALIAILQMTGLLMTSAANLAMTNIQLQEARIAFQRMYEFTSLDLENIQDVGEMNKVSEFSNLKVSNISFRFPGRSILLESVSFELKKGEMIAIWGEIGSGKSTLFNILQRHLVHESGDILINDTDISTIPLSELRFRIGVVPQVPVIFNGPLIDNIILGQPPGSDGELESFMEEYELNEIFRNFPNGYGTLLEEDGVNVSGGQRRLINLARTLNDQPQVLLLDEPTSDLDQESAHQLFSLLEKLREDKAIIVLTHDVRLASKSDRIYLLEKGRMDVRGTHEELIAYDNLYSRSWEDYLIPLKS